LGETVLRDGFVFADVVPGSKCEAPKA